MGAGAERPDLAVGAPRIPTRAARTVADRPEKDSDVARTRADPGSGAAARETVGALDGSRDERPTSPRRSVDDRSPSSEYRRGVDEGFVSGVLQQTWRGIDPNFSQARADAFTEALSRCPDGVMALLLPLSRALVRARP